MMNETNASTYSFYQSLAQYTTEIPKDNLTFVDAQTIYDHFLIQSTHNESFLRSIGGFKGEVFQQVKTLQDTHSVNYNTWNQKSLAPGESLLNEADTVLWEAFHASGPAQQSIRVMAASSDHFYQVFKLLDLLSSNESQFTSIVNHAATLVFEVFTRDGSDDQFFVRVGIHNGTTISEGNVTLDFYPIFNHTKDHMDYYLFTEYLFKGRKFDSLSIWCQECDASVLSCDNYRYIRENRELMSLSYNRLSLAGAGAIGAGVTTGVFLLVLPLVCRCARR